MAAPPMPRLEGAVRAYPHELSPIFLVRCVLTATAFQAESGDSPARRRGAAHAEIPSRNGSADRSGQPGHVGRPAGARVEGATARRPGMELERLLRRRPCGRPVGAEEGLDGPDAWRRLFRPVPRRT